MLLGGIAVSLVVSVGLHNVCIRKLVSQKLLYPRTRDDIRTVLLTGVKLHAGLSGNMLLNAVINLL